MKTLSLTRIILLAGAFTLIACTESPERAARFTPVSVDSQQVVDDGINYYTQWGTIKSMRFERRGKYSAYYSITTDKVSFSELDVTDFPGDNLSVGDRIFKKIHMTKRTASVSMCRNDSCLPHGTCYFLIPCFKRYKHLVPDATKPS